MPEIVDRESLQKWLEDRPHEDATVIAARAALRGLPGLAATFNNERIDYPLVIVLSVFRANAVASVAANGPTRRQHVQDAARSAADFAQSAHSFLSAGISPLSAAHAATLSARSADSAASAASAALSARSARSAADSATDSADSAAWKAVDADAARLTAGIDHPSLLATPLWPDDPPKGLAENWPALRDALLTDDPLWRVWTDWYQDRLDGEPMNVALELEKALIPDADWEQGPAHVNAIIADLIAKHAPDGSRSTESPALNLDVLLASRDLRASLADFELDDLARLVRMVPFVEDIKALSDPHLAHDRASKLSELSDLMGDLGRDCKSQLSRNAPDYVRLAANRYQREAKKGIRHAEPDELHFNARPGRLWDIGLELAGALKDVEVETSFPRHLFDRLDVAVAKHRDLMRDYFAAALARMRPLDRIETSEDATKEGILDALQNSVDGLDSQDWGDAPTPDPEIAAEMADRVEELGDILERINRTTDPDRAADLERTFWRKAKAASMTIVRLGLKVALFTGWTVGTAAGLMTLFPTEFALALRAIQKIFTNLPPL